MTGLAREGDVFVLDLGDTENRFSPAWLSVLEDALTEVERTDGPRALVTAATGKFWSNGLDLDWLSTHPEEGEAYVARVQALFARVLTLPVPTVAAVQGHCFAAGAMLSLCHDAAVMRADRGFWCLPEVDIAIPFTVGMGALIQGRLTPAAATEAMTTGRRFGGAEAAAAGIVLSAVPEERVRETALERAAALAPKAGVTLGTIKQRMHAGVVAALAS